MGDCSGAKDRTGFDAAMILAALGVDEDTIAADYKLSSQVLDCHRNRSAREPNSKKYWTTHRYRPWPAFALNKCAPEKTLRTADDSNFAFLEKSDHPLEFRK